uniref:Uncharacterized protein n=1 Tax=Timema tahoe TaxID=61484 RepID=A0A7R9IME3_9NEOP|nr:unnamed protein product [Timema tahoe]
MKLAHSIQFQEILNKKHKHNQDILTVIKSAQGGGASRTSEKPKEQQPYNAHRTCSARFTCLEEEREGASADMASSEATTLAQLSSVSAAECFSGIEVQSYRVSRGPYRVNMGRLGLELSLKICIFHFKFVPPSFAQLSHATLERLLQSLLCSYATGLKPLIYLLSHVKSSSIDGLNNPINNETQHHSSISYENELDSCPQIKQELSISKVALDLISVLCQEHNVSTSFLLYDCSKISQEHKGTRLLRTCYSAACHRDEEQGYFGPVPALHVTERRGARLRRTCYSAACDRDEEQGYAGPVTAQPVTETRSKEEADLVEDVNNQVQFYDPCVGTMRTIPNVFTSKDKPKQKIKEKELCLENREDQGDIEEADMVEDATNEVQFYDPCVGTMRSIPNVFTSKDKYKTFGILHSAHIRQMNPMHVVSACSFKAAVPNLFQFAYPQLAWFLSAYPQTQILQAPHLPNLFHPLQIPKTSLKKGLLMYKSPCVTYHVSDTSWNKTGAIRRAILLHRSENTALDRSEQRKQLNVACGRLVVWSLVCLGLRLSTLSDVFTSNKLHATSSHDDDAEGPTGPTKVLATYPELLGSIPGASIFSEKSFQIIWEAVALERATQLNVDK